MRVTFLSTTGQLGGAENSLLQVVAGLRRLEPSWGVSLISPSDGPLLSSARELGVATELLRYPRGLARLGRGEPGVLGAVRLGRSLAGAGWSTARYIGSLRDALARHRPHFLHANGLKMHVLAARARPSGASLVWHVHDYVASRPVISALLRAHVTGCSAVVTSSHSVAADLRRALGAGVPVTAVYNGVDLDRFSPNGPELDLDDLAGLPRAPPGTVKVGLVATLARWKGHRVFLEAMARLPSSPRVRGYIVGGPIYETIGSQWSIDELRRDAARLGLGECVGFTGQVHDPPAAIRALDVIVHASTRPEPFGMVIAEAMACGRAVIVSGAGGAAEIATDAVDALVFQPGEAAGLAERITRLAAEPALGARLGAAARASAVARFDGLRLAREVIDLYRAVDQQKTLAASPAPSDARPRPHARPARP